MKNTVLGFTGSRNGMTPEQADKVIELIRQIEPVQAIDGMCIGSDAEFAKICKKLGIFTHGFPGHYKNNPSDRSMVDPEGRDVMQPSQPHLERNRQIVGSSDAMIATPAGDDFKARGGTNFTIKYAIKMGVPIYIVLPDGTVINDIETKQNVIC